MYVNLTEVSSVSRAVQDRPHGAHLALHGLKKAYAGRAVLDGIYLKIAPGEFVALVGRSGCGKSTLLRAIAGLESPDSGQVKIGGGGKAPEVRMMFQDARLLPWKTVLDNVTLGLSGASARGLEALSTVGLAGRAHEWPAVLSGGQRQRVALARALVRTPHLLLLDEPLGALDALTRMEMQHLIESLWRLRGFTAMLVTHDVQEALALADRVLLIEDGKIVLDLHVTLPRPRVRGSVALAAMEQQVLDRVLASMPA